MLLDEKKKNILGLVVWLVLSILMLNDVGEKLEVGLHAVLITWFFGAIFSYYIVAYFFGWTMPTITFTASLVRGEHDFLRFFMFLLFVSFWFWGFFGF